jgi:hypothetical protein
VKVWTTESESMDEKLKYEQEVKMGTTGSESMDNRK